MGPRLCGGQGAPSGPSSEGGICPMSGAGEGKKKEKPAYKSNNPTNKRWEIRLSLGLRRLDLGQVVEDSGLQG